MRPAWRARVAGLDRLAHRGRHRGGILGARDGAGQQHGVAAGLHRERRVRGGADAGVEDHRHARGLDDQPQVVGVGDAHAAADRRAERHHRRAAGVLEPAREDRVVARVGQDGEAVGDELLGGVEQLRRVGQQRLVVADHLELDPARLERLAARAARWSTASRAVKQPAVFGSTKQPQSSSTSRIDPRADGSTRRSATVAISAPDARTASRIDVEAAEAAGADDQARAEACGRRSPSARIALILPEPPAGPRRGRSATSACARPGAARNHLAVDGRGDAAPVARRAGGRDRVGDRRAVAAARAARR